MAIDDDKSPICIPFILEKLKEHQDAHDGLFSIPPFFIGLNGVQGVGKTTLVTILERTLKGPPYLLPVCVLSIDDLYLTHADQVKLAQSNPLNRLVQHRGAPGTHDMTLATTLFAELKNEQPTRIPRYDKSQHNGQGDRMENSKWVLVNQDGQPKIKVIILEGWCVGFKSLPDDQVKAKWEESNRAHCPADLNTSRITLSKFRLEDLLFMNRKLRDYDVITEEFDAMIHLDAIDIFDVYEWRLQQEAELRQETGHGMSNEQVINFVDGYYPAYELFSEKLREGILKDKGCQLRLTLKRDRKVKDIFVI
ncbi:P-loop containing nucleoside triphosphate hydrolase protein [Lipomyces tetrasporus]|uniref:P-loop containing nucleoside triphosphate hydrolase protein n=1 Tax=Lipomyces tetrasporus TaxID=54092 RepID=A0AAD7VQ45_9ASCO|nr:P-loop containing nucleoside triphosphate hydrolase protein [Lipomyces tetrasporus]KAJ8098512.1 P-loop containing nucleoside triphosphate hydrolase protein [Lipomyces tetrasporus]